MQRSYFGRGLIVILMVLLVGCGSYGNEGKTDDPEAILTVSATEIQAGSSVHLDASKSIYESLEWTIDGAVLSSCSGDLCDLTLTSVGNFEIGITASSKSSESVSIATKTTSVLITVTPAPVVKIASTALTSSSTVNPNAYDPNAPWIAEYDIPTKVAIHAKKLNHDQVLTTTSPLVLRLDASAATTLFTDSACSLNAAASLGNAIGCWKDLSPNHNNATTSASYKPIWAGNQLNNQPTVVFDRAFSQYMSADGVMTSIDNSSTIFVVSRSTNTSSANRWQNIIFSIHKSTNSYDNILRLGISATTAASDPNSVYFAVGSAVEKGSTLTGVTANPYVFRINASEASLAEVFVTSAGGNTQQLYWSDGTGTANVSNLSTADKFSIGQEYDPGPTTSDFFKGDVAELIIYNQVINNTLAAQVEAYLTAKWIP